MTKSRRQRIVEAAVARLEAIRKSDDFETDAGLEVFTGEVPELGEDDPDVAIAVLIGVQQPTQQIGTAVVYGDQGLPIELQAIAKGSLDEAWLAAEQVLADIKRAFELEDRTLGGLVMDQIVRGPTITSPREAGNTTVGISQLYFAPYKEAWGNP